MFPFPRTCNDSYLIYETFLKKNPVSAPAEKYNNKTDKLCRSYCCCYYSNCAPVSCHFPISLQLLHRLKDLRIFEPIAQLLFHSTLKAYHQLNSALKQNHSMSRCGYSVLWSIYRNSKALNGQNTEYRAAFFISGNLLFQFFCSRLA